MVANRPADFAFVVVAYNPGSDLATCLSSIESCRDFASRENIEVEAIVVDNASADSAAKDAVSAFPWAQFCFNECNTGFAVATNQGARRSAARYIATLNPDATADPGFAASAVRLLDAEPTIGVLGPLCRWAGGGPDEAPGVSGGDLPKVETPLIASRLAALFKNPFVRETPTREVDGPFPMQVRYVWGTGLVVRRGALEGGPLFSERWFLSGEEFELCDRLRLAGYLAATSDQLQVEHRVGQSYSTDLKTARVVARLQRAVRFDLIHERWGRRWALINELLQLADRSILTVLLRGHQALNWRDGGTSRRSARALMAARYSAEAGASLGLLLRGRRYGRAADSAARAYLSRRSGGRNGGGVDLDDRHWSCP